MKNILFVSLNAYPVLDTDAKGTDVVFGGAEVQAALLARTLRSMKHQVSCVVTKSAYMQKKSINGVTVIPISGTVQLVREVIRSKASHVAFRSRGKKQWLLALTCWVSRKKFVYMFSHDDLLVRSNFSFFAWIMHYRSIQSAALVVTQNTYQTTEYQNIWTKKNVLALANSIKVTPYNNTSKENDVLWVGRSDQWKRPELVIDLATKLSDVSFTIVLTRGNDQAYHKRIEKQCRALKNVSLHSFVPLSEIQKIYNTHKVYLNTSVAEGYPNSFLQSAVGSCCIVSLSADPNDMLSISKAGVLVSQEDMDLEVKKILDNENLRQEYCIRAHKYVSCHNNISMNSKLFAEALV